MSNSDSQAVAALAECARSFALRTRRNRDALLDVAKTSSGFSCTYEGYTYTPEDPAWQSMAHVIRSYAPESLFCQIVNCRPVTTVVASCPSGGWVVKTTASYAKDMIFGGDAVKGKVKQVIKADGKRDEFCKACSYDKDLQFIPEVSACNEITNGCDLEKDVIGSLPTPGLGEGWSDDSQMGALDCFKGTVKFRSGTKAIVSLKSASSYEEIHRSLSRSLSVGAKGKLSAMLFSGTIEAEYARLIEDSQYSKSFYFLQKVELPASVFRLDGYGLEALNNYGRGVYDVGGPERFRKVCGNRLITEIKQGASLYVTLKIHFASHYDKKTFETHAGASFGGLVKAKASIKNAVQTYKIDGKLELSAYQAGGNALQLAKVFGKCDKHYCIANCALDNLDACDGITDGILSYAQNDFPEQIDFKNGVVSGSAAPISYTMLKISDVIGLPVAKSVVTSPIVAARMFLGELYDNQTKILKIVEHAFAFPEAHHIPGDIALQNLNIVQGVLENNVALIESAGLACYAEPTECEELRVTVVDKLTNVTLLLE